MMKQFSLLFLIYRHFHTEVYSIRLDSTVVLHGGKTIIA